MITSLLPPNKSDKIAVISLGGAIILFLIPELLINPYSRELIQIPNIGGIFYRSILVMAIVSIVWVYQYGWVKTFWICMIYYGFNQLIYTFIVFPAYGYNPLSYANIFWWIRILWMISAIFAMLRFGSFKLNSKSVITGLAFFSWFVILIYIWPISYFDGEGYIPLSPIPQLEEFIYNILFPLWFYFLVKFK